MSKLRDLMAAERELPHGALMATRIECEHGQIARSCEICAITEERDEAWALLRETIDHVECPDSEYADVCSVACGGVCLRARIEKAAMTDLFDDADRVERLRLPALERITGVAIKVEGLLWALPAPARHNHLIHAWSQSHWVNGGPTRIPEHDDGFVTSTGRFVDRVEAIAIARAAGQTESIRCELFSEDVW